MIWPRSIYIKKFGWVFDKRICITCSRVCRAARPQKQTRRAATFFRSAFETEGEKHSTRRLDGEGGTSWKIVDSEKRERRRGPWWVSVALWQMVWHWQQMWAQPNIQTGGEGLLSYKVHSEWGENTSVVISVSCEINSYWRECIGMRGEKHLVHRDRSGFVFVSVIYTSSKTWPALLPIRQPAHALIFVHSCVLSHVTSPAKHFVIFNGRT